MAFTKIDHDEIYKVEIVSHFSVTRWMMDDAAKIGQNEGKIPAIKFLRNTFIETYQKNLSLRDAKDMVEDWFETHQLYFKGHLHPGNQMPTQPYSGFSDPYKDGTIKDEPSHEPKRAMDLGDILGEALRITHESNRRRSK